MADRGIASTARASAAPAAHAAAPSKYERLIGEAKRVAVAKAIVVHPCDETSLRGAIEAAKIGLIIPTLVGPAAKIERAAREHQIDISAFEVVDAPTAMGRPPKPSN
jgi:phosphate acetyltransferase